MSCSQPENSGLLMSCQTVDLVSRGVVVSSGSFPLTSLAISEQGFGFLVHGGGHELQLFAPRLSQAICSFRTATERQVWARLSMADGEEEEV